MQKFTVDELDRLIEENFAIAPMDGMANRFGYIRQLVAESKESTDLLHSITNNEINPRMAAYGAFVSGVITGLLLAERRKQ